MKIYRVPVVVNAKLEFYEAEYIPTIIAMPDGSYYQQSIELTLSEIIKQTMESEQHDNYEIKQSGMILCK